MSINYKSTIRYRLVLFLLTISVFTSFFSSVFWAEENTNESEVEYRSELIEDFDQDGLEALAGLTGSSVTSSVDGNFIEHSIRDSKVLYVNNIGEMLLAVASGKADYCAADQTQYNYAKSQYPEMVISENHLLSFGQGYIFPKDDKSKALCAEINEFLAKETNSGYISEIIDKWRDNTDLAAIDYPTSGENGVLKVCTDTTCIPYSIIVDGRYSGSELEILAKFAEEYGYGLDIVSVDFSGVLAGVSVGKFDIGYGNITINEERKESLTFSDPIYYLNYKVVAMGSSDAIAASDNSNIFDQLKNSFIKTFVLESRWNMILQGIGVTLLITVAAGAIGSVGAFLLCILNKLENKVINAIINVFVKIMQGLPMVVVLMLLYYLVFGNSAINPVVIAIIGFSINTTAYGAVIFQSGIDGVDYGQQEAAEALGFSKWQTFFRYIFPQAAKQFMPVYRSELVSLLKGTAVVGYIAIQDLTRMGDIIRSRTFEPFFPLISTAIIYFLLSWIIVLVLRQVERKLFARKESK